MNEQDKKAFNSWLNPRDYHFDMDGDCWLNLEIVSIFSEMEEAWQAACEYKQKEIDEFQWELNYRSERIKKLRDENAKLKECVEFYADTSHWGIAKPMDEVCIDPSDHYDPYVSDTSFSNRARGGKRARQVLKEVDNNQLDDTK